MKSRAFPLFPFLKEYLRERPLFLSLIRAKEAYLFQQYLPFVHPVLDVGCGDGFFASLALARKFEIRNSKFEKGKVKNIDVGLDVEDSRMKEAEGSGVYKKLVVYGGEMMPFRNNTYKTVVSNCVFEHIPNIKKTVSEIHRVLKPGGLLITTVVAKPWEDHLLGSKLVGSEYKSWMRKKQVHVNMLTYAEWSMLFKKQGFRIEEVIGYLDAKAVQTIDVAHYLSIPSLLSYKLWKRWVLWKDMPYPMSLLEHLLSGKVQNEKSGALFFVLKKV
jgi:ubiquinone/menaquinone biosynthesis C-methylase UbiE